MLTGTRFTLLALMVCVSVGCTQQDDHIRVRVIDDKSLQPLSGVAVTPLRAVWQPANPGLYPVKCHFPYPAGARVTDGQGMAELKDLDDCWVIIEREGYSEALIRRLPPKPRGSIGYFQESDLSYVDGVVTVPLSKSAARK